MSAPSAPVNSLPTETFATHGGRLAAAQAAFPHAPGPWLDLSTGINPHAYPVGELAAATWQRLPDADAEARLAAAARRCYGVPAGVGLVAAPGTQALIQLLPHVLPARRVAVYGFGYQEHPRAWQAAGAEVTVTEDVDALAAADVAVVVNPNNPDGRHVAPDALAALASRLAARGGTLIVDEAFADALPDGMSLACHLENGCEHPIIRHDSSTSTELGDVTCLPRALLPLSGEGGPASAGTDGVDPEAANPIRRPSGATFPGAGKESPSHAMDRRSDAVGCMHGRERRTPPARVLVLRSFGKFFGLAGLRLGFAVGDVGLCRALGEALGPWAVSGPALAIGARALADAAWQAAMRERLAAEAERLDALLLSAGLAVIGGTPLFRLARHPDAPAAFERLARAGILVRPFGQRPTWLRFGLPPDEAAWARLTATLKRPGTC